MIVVTGCAYGDLGDLDKTLQRYEDLQLIRLTDIASLDFKGMRLQDETYLPYSDIGASYIRYPYDLIPPNSRDFFIREKTEFLKTLATMLAEVDLTPVNRSWVMRNRIFGLGEMAKFGFDVASSLFALGTSISPYPLNTSGRCTVKAAGNCYFSDIPTADSESPLPQIEVASDGEDHALIFPASDCDKDEVALIQKTLGATFTQETILAEAEYRVYCVGEQVFAYKRESTEKHDGSAAPYIKASEEVESIRERLIQFCKTLEVGYLCCDALATKQGLIFIDLNPNGGMPRVAKQPEVVEAVAEYLYSKAGKK